MRDILILLAGLSPAGSILTMPVMLSERYIRKCISGRCAYVMWIIVLLRFVLPVPSPLGAIISPWHEAKVASPVYGI